MKTFTQVTEMRGFIELDYSGACLVRDKATRGDLQEFSPEEGRVRRSVEYCRGVHAR